jgi:uncharacterized phiE125 gp8 family phage protein
MALVMTSGPGLEPVTVSEAKAHLRLDSAAEDLLIAGLILTSRLHIEAALGLALISQAWTVTFDCWPEGDAVALPLRPVQSIEEVRVREADGGAQVVDPESYALDGQGVPARFIWRGAVRPTPRQKAFGIEIDIVAGFGDGAADVPEPIRHASRIGTSIAIRSRSARPGRLFRGRCPSFSLLIARCAYDGDQYR